MKQAFYNLQLNQGDGSKESPILFDANPIDHLNYVIIGIRYTDTLGRTLPCSSLYLRSTDGKYTVDLAENATLLHLLLDEKSDQEKAEIKQAIADGVSFDIGLKIAEFGTYVPRTVNISYTLIQTT